MNFVTNNWTQLKNSVGIVEFFWFSQTLFLLVGVIGRKYCYADQMKDDEQRQQQYQIPVQQKQQSQQQPEIKQGSDFQIDNHDGFQQQEMQKQEQDQKEIDINIQVNQDQQSNNNIQQVQPQQPVVEKKPIVLFLLGCERFTVDYLPWFLIGLLNIATLGFYIYNCFMFFLWILCVIFINELKIIKNKFNSDSQANAEFIHHIIIFSLFLNNFINNQQQV